MLALEWNLDDAKQAWFEEGMEQGLEQGLEQGRSQEREAVAVKLIRMGFQFDDVQKVTGLSLQHIQKLAKSNLDV